MRRELFVLPDVPLCLVKILHSDIHLRQPIDHGLRIAGSLIGNLQHRKAVIVSFARFIDLRHRTERPQIPYPPPVNGVRHGRRALEVSPLRQRIDLLQFHCEFALIQSHTPYL